VYQTDRPVRALAAAGGRLYVCEQGPDGDAWRYTVDGRVVDADFDTSWLGGLRFAADAAGTTFFGTGSGLLSAAYASMYVFDAAEYDSRPVPAVSARVYGTLSSSDAPVRVVGFVDGAAAAFEYRVADKSMTPRAIVSADQQPALDLFLPVNGSLDDGRALVRSGGFGVVDGYGVSGDYPMASADVMCFS